MKKGTRRNALTLCLALCVLVCALLLPAAAADPVDHTPTVTVNINYQMPDLSTLTAGGAALVNANGNNGIYYISATAAHFAANAATTTKPSEAFWRIAVDGTGKVTVDGLYLKPGDLISVSGMTVTGLRANELQIGGYTVKYAETVNGGLGIPTMATNAGSGNTAVLYNHTYYVRTDTAWLPAQAKVGSLYYMNYSNSSATTSATADAVTAANAVGTATDLLVLGNATVTTAVTVNATVTTYCCNAAGGDTITVAAGGALTLNGKVYNYNGSEYATVKQTGGTITDAAGNTVETTAGSAAVHGTNTTLNITGGSAAKTADVDGSFAKLSGYVNLTGATTINGTNALTGADAYVVSHVDSASLTVNGGTVHTLCVFPKTNQIQLSAGTLIFDLSATSNMTYVNGTGTGDVIVNGGNVGVYGRVDDMNLYSTTEAARGSNGYLYGTAARSQLSGASTLTISADSGVTGAVTQYVRGVGYNDSYAKLVIANTVKTEVKVYGTFDTISGVVTMYQNEDLTIKNLSGTQTITGMSTSSVLTIDGADAAYDVSKFQLSGTFGSVITKTVDLNIGQGVAINQRFEQYSADVALSNGAVIGNSAQDGFAVCKIQDGTMTVTGTSTAVYATVEGLVSADGSANASFHFAPTSVGYPRLSGTFKAVTGRAYLCSDLTVNSTQGANGNQLSLVGGCAYYNDNGMTWKLTLTDRDGTTTVALNHGVNASGVAMNPGFSGIEVADTYSETNHVSLTMATGALPVNLGANVTDQFEDNGLLVNGKTDTVVALTTNAIYGAVNGVSVTGAPVALTGSNATTLYAVTGSTGCGATVTDGSLTMTNYAVDGKTTGVIADGSTAALTNLTVVGRGTHGMKLGVTEASTVSLDAVTVSTADSAKTGVEIDCGTDVTLSNAIHVTAATTGIYVKDGTLTNVTAGVSSGVGVVTATGTSNQVALLVDKGSVVLDNYTFDAKLANGTGVLTTDASDITLTLSYSGSKPDTRPNRIWGGQTGLIVGKKTVATVSDYFVYGSTSQTQADATSVSGDAAARVYGALQLSGANYFLGYQYGMYIAGGSVTNFKTADGWTLDEKTGTASGSGQILAGTASSATAIYALSNAGVAPEIVFSDYNIVSDGASGSSYGLYLNTGRAYLSGGTQTADLRNLAGKTGDGVFLTGSAYATVDNMTIAATGATGSKAYAAQVASGTLNLGTGTTLATTGGGNAVATVKGNSLTDSYLYVVDGNTAISAQGLFHRATGYLTTTGDLTVRGTVCEAPLKYSDAYVADSLTVYGAATTHDLNLGNTNSDCEAVIATLVDASKFASINIVGNASTQQTLTVAGGLTVTNADMAYGLKARYADVTFTAAAAETTDFVRALTATQPSAIGLDAGEGTTVYLTDTVNVTAAADGLALTSNAVVTNLKAADVWQTTFADTGLTAQSSGTISVTTGKAISVANTATLLLGEYTILGKTNALYVDDTAQAYVMTATPYPTDEVANYTYRMTASTSYPVEVKTTGHVTVQNYLIQSTNGSTRAAVRVANGIVTLSGGKTTGMTDAQAIEVVADAAAAPQVILTDGAIILGGKDNGNVVEVTGSATAASAAVLDVVDAVIKTTDNTKSEAYAAVGVKLNAYAAGNFYADASIANDATPTTGVKLTADSSVATFYGGSYFGKTNAIVQDAGTTWIKGGTFDTIADSRILTDDVVDLNAGKVYVTGGTISGKVAAAVTTGKTTGLYTSMADDLSTVYLYGTLTEATGKVTTAGNLTVTETTDSTYAPLTGAYASGAQYDVLNVIGGSAADDLTVNEGVVNVKGSYDAMTLGTATTAVTAVVVDNTTAAGNLTLNCAGTPETTLTVRSDKTLGVTGTLTGKGSLSLETAARTTVTGGVNLTGDIDLAANAVMTTPESLDLIGNITLAANANLTAGQAIALTGNLTLAADAEVAAQKNITVGGDLAIAAAASVTTLENVAVTGELKADGAIEAASTNSVSGGLVTVSKTGTVTGNMTVSGTTTITGAVTGIVTGQTYNGVKPTLYFDTIPTAPTANNLKIAGVYDSLETAVIPAVGTTAAVYNTVSIAGDTTVEQTKNSDDSEGMIYAVGGTGTLTLTSGTVDLVASGTGLSVGSAATATVRGTVSTFTGSALMTGDTNVAGGTGTLTGSLNSKAYNLSVSGTANLTALGTAYLDVATTGGKLTLAANASADSLTVNGGTLQLDGLITTPSTTVSSGSLVVSNTGKLQVEQGGSFVVNANGHTVTFKQTQVGYMLGTTTVTGNAITSLPLATVPINQYNVFSAWCDEADYRVDDEDYTSLVAPITPTANLVLREKHATVVDGPNIGGGGSVSIAELFQVDITVGAGGTASEQSGTFNGGEDLTLTFTPATGFRVADVKIDGTSVGAVQTYTFAALDAQHTVEVTFTEADNVSDIFTDIDDSTWCHDAVQFVYENGIMNGATTTTFAPARTLNRGMWVTMLYRLAGSPAVTGESPYSDVIAGTTWCYDAVIWANQNGIVTGYSDGTFHAADAVTRQQLVTFLYRYAKAFGKDVSVSEGASLTDFADANQIGAFAADAVLWAADAGILQGSNGNVNPRTNTNRGQAATFLMRFIQKYGK